MSSEVFHEETHVSKVLLANAAFKSRIFRVRRGSVDVCVHLALLLEQDVVDRTDDLKIKSVLLLIVFTKSNEFINGFKF